MRASLMKKVEDQRVENGAEVYSMDEQQERLVKELLKIMNMQNFPPVILNIIGLMALHNTCPYVCLIFRK